MTTTNDPLLGATYDGRYLIDRRIGSGGMANVYLAQDETLGRRVAIKVLHQRYAEDSQFVERFLREASAAAKLNHPNIVQVYDRGQASGSYYIAMEYIEGMTLKDLVRRRGALTEQEVLAYGRQALHALRFAHRNGIVHRDVKPQNMMVDTDGRLKIADFGIARAAADADQGLTEAGSIVGTAQYLSPEQAQGLEVSAPSDLYSLGVVMYEMSTGRVAFDGDSPVNVALKHVKDPVPRPSSIKPGISPGLESIILKALEKDPADRYGSADEMLADLDRARDGTTTQAMTQVLPGVGAAAATTRVQPITPPVSSRVYEQPVPPEPAWPESNWDDDSEQPPKSPWRWLAPLLIVLLLALAIGAYLLVGGDKGDPVPNVVGLQAAAAEAQLKEAGFVVGNTTQEASDTAPINEVIDQDPNAEEELEKGGEVDLVISSGPAPIEVPDTAGMTKAAATAAITEAGFPAPAFKEVASDDVEEGLIISSTPAAGTEAPRTAKIVLNISTGPAANEVPNVVGMTIEQARAALREEGFSVDASAVNSSKPRNEVLTQVPGSGAEAEEGASIKLTYASGSNAVPDVAGKSEADATTDLEAAGFAVGGTDEEPTDNPDRDGTVGSTTPGAGQVLELDSTIRLVILRFQQPVDPGNNGNGNGNGNTPPQQ